MEGMTPEERLTRIENILASVTESQVRHEVDIEKLKSWAEQHSRDIDKQNAGIRDLIVVSRTVLESQQRTDDQIRELTTKVNQLTENIEKLIQGRGPNGR
jgi:hypothetical protein